MLSFFHVLYENEDLKHQLRRMQEEKEERDSEHSAELKELRTVNAKLQEENTALKQRLERQNDDRSGQGLR